MVPSVIGLNRGDVLVRLSSVVLRTITVFTESATGGGVAAVQSPVAGTTVPQYSVVRVEYPNPVHTGETGIEGPEPISGLLEGTISAVFIGPDNAGIAFSPGQGIPPFSFVLYRDTEQVAREGYMRRGALLALAQRAFTGQSNVRVSFENKVVKAFWIFR